MKLLIIRHGDPDYSIDSLTEKGWREAEMLAERMTSIKVDAFYVSPLGRARDTASLTLKRVGMTATTCPWLREFTPPVRHSSNPDHPSIAWDWLPLEWTTEQRFFDRDHWFEPDCMREGNVGEEARKVAIGLDEILALHGYRRDGEIYRAESPSNGTIAMFCHFGVECVMLWHLLGISPMVLWHGTCAAPTAITTLVTEERQPGIARFRMTCFGDTSHLAAHGEPPAFAGRFRECFTNDYERA